MADKYAAPGGDDGAAGTQQNPYRTAQRLVDSLGPGDTGYLRAGLYNEFDRLIFKRRGGANEKITLRNYEAEKAELRGGILTERGADHIVIQGIKIDGSYGPVGKGHPTSSAGRSDKDTKPAVDILSNHVTVRHCDVSNRRPGNNPDLAGSGFHIGSEGRKITAVGVVIEHNRIHECGQMPRINREHGMYCSSTRDLVIQDNLIYDNADRGIQLYPNTQGALVQRNIVDGNGWGLVVDKASANNTIRNNIFSNPAVSFNLYQGPKATGKNNRVHDNVFWSSNKAGEPGKEAKTKFGDAIVASNNVTADPRYRDRVRFEVTNLSLGWSKPKDTTGGEAPTEEESPTGEETLTGEETPVSNTLEQNIQKVSEYLLAIERAGTPYRWWHEGDPALGAGPPAHAVDKPAPRPQDVNAVFCAGLGNLALRRIGRPVPKLPPYNGGTGAWRRAYGPKMVPFKLANAKEGDVAFRPFNHGGPRDQGHWAYVGPNGKLIQSFAFNGASTKPGVTSNVSVAQSHGNGYYVYLLKAKDWLSPLAAKKRPDRDKPEPRPEPQPEPLPDPLPDETFDGTDDLGKELFTAEQLSAIVQNPDMAAMQRHRAALVPEMKRGEITTPERVAAFLAEIGHETDHLNTLEEYGDRDYWKYLDRNSGVAGEWRYHGRGYIQLTWSKNYRAAGDAIGVNLVEEPELAERPEVAARVAVWFWNSRDLNPLADRGDFREITRRINGGFNGYEDRLKYFNRAKRTLGSSDTPAGSGGDLRAEFKPNLVAVGQKDEEAMLAAALVFRRRGFFVTSTAGADGVRGLDGVFSKEPLGTRQVIVVGGPALGALLPGSQRYVFNPHRPDESDYIGAVGRGFEDTLRLLEGLLRDHAGEGADAEFRAVYEAQSDSGNGTHGTFPALLRTGTLEIGEESYGIYSEQSEDGSLVITQNAGQTNGS